MRVESLGPRSLVAIALLIGIALPVSAKKLELDSRAVDAGIEIDGNLADWQGAMVYVKRESLFLGIANDGEYVYVAVQSRSTETNRSIVINGMIVWFDPDGSKERLGIRYPMGLAATGRMNPGERPLGGREFEEKFKASLGTFQALGPRKGDSEELLVENRFGVEIASNYTGGDLIYELKVPMRRSESQPHAIGAAPGDAIRLTLETPDIEVDSLSAPPPGSERDYRGGANRDPLGGDTMGDDRMGSFPDQTTGGGATGGHRFPDQFSIKAKVRLATP
ncbi:MAG: hypothetical protein R3344_05485 [Acidobacteriota bacterium]|nr:hypothetical protein [Acidobacteriota bacterium]